MVAAMLLLAAALDAGAQSGNLASARAELNDAEIAYEKSLIVYLRCGGPSDDFDEVVGRQAKVLGVGDFTLTHMAESEAVVATPFRIGRMQIHGRGEFGDVASLLHRISSLALSRVLDFETVHLGEVRGRTVSLRRRRNAWWLSVRPSASSTRARSPAPHVRSAVTSISAI